MTSPIPLTATSGERIADTAELADAYVDDGGMTPAGALAKAAAETGLPVHHLDIVVRAFNTGRAVRQLSERDPWSKAAGYPSTTAADVLAVMDRGASRPAEKSAADSDYALPPDFSLPAPRAASVKIASYDAAPVEVPVPQTEYPQNPIWEVAAAIDELRDRVPYLAPSEYAAVKVAVAHLRPGCDVFDYIESYAPDAARAGTKAAAVPPDPRVTTSHPVVVGAVKVADAKAAYREPAVERPVGYVRHRRDITGTWFEPVEPMFAADDTKLAVELDDTKSGRGTLMGNFASTASAVGGTPFRNGMFGGLINPKFSPEPQSVVDQKELGKLQTSLDNLDHQTAVTDIVSDPRFLRSDPRTVIETYRTLSDLAPNVMRNRSVAADLIHRRLQTGPLSAFDLSNLLTMESNWVKSRQPVREPDDN